MMCKIKATFLTTIYKNLADLLHTFLCIIFCISSDGEQF